MNRLFVLRERVHFDNMIAALGQNWQAMSAAGRPLGVTVAPYRKTRSTEANALMWVWLTQVAQQAWTGGRQWEKEVWHEHCRREFLPERNARGDDKWQDLPDGTRLCTMSTTRLNVEEMNLYMTKLEAFFVGDLGVELH